MDFYKPEKNLPADWDFEGKYQNDVATYHMDMARIAIRKIKEINPVLATAVADAILHSLLAANVHNHAMFQPREKESGQ